MLLSVLQDSSLHKIITRNLSINHRTKRRKVHSSVSPLPTIPQKSAVLLAKSRETTFHALTIFCGRTRLTFRTPPPHTHTHPRHHQDSLARRVFAPVSIVVTCTKIVYLAQEGNCFSPTVVQCGELQQFTPSCVQYGHRCATKTETIAGFARCVVN